MWVHTCHDVYVEVRAASFLPPCGGRSLLSCWFRSFRMALLSSPSILLQDCWAQVLNLCSLYLFLASHCPLPPFWGRVSLGSPSWPGTGYRGKVGLKLSEVSCLCPLSWVQGVCGPPGWPENLPSAFSDLGFMLSSCFPGVSLSLGDSQFDSVTAHQSKLEEVPQTHRASVSVKRISVVRWEGFFLAYVHLKQTLSFWSPWERYHEEERKI